MLPIDPERSLRRRPDRAAGPGSAQRAARRRRLRLRGRLQGHAPGDDSADGKVYCYTNFEPADARRVYANFEQPDLKATFTFSVTAPAHWTVLSNQPAPAPQDAGDGTATWHFPPTPRMSTYLTAVVAGEYHLVTGTHTTPGGQVIPLGLACRASLADHLEPDDMFTVTKQGFDYYTARVRGALPVREVRPGLRP